MTQRDLNERQSENLTTGRSRARLPVVDSQMLALPSLLCLWSNNCGRPWIEPGKSSQPWCCSANQRHTCYCGTFIGTSSVLSDEFTQDRSSNLAALSGVYAKVQKCKKKKRKRGRESVRKRSDRYLFHCLVDACYPPLHPYNRCQAFYLFIYLPLSCLRCNKIGSRSCNQFNASTTLTNSSSNNSTV